MSSILRPLELYDSNTSSMLAIALSTGPSLNFEPYIACIILHVFHQNNEFKYESLKEEAIIPDPTYKESRIHALAYFFHPHIRIFLDLKPKANYLSLENGKKPDTMEQNTRMS